MSSIQTGVNFNPGATPLPVKGASPFSRMATSLGSIYQRIIGPKPPSRWKLLPKGLLQKVSQFLLSGELARAERVCTSWRAMVSSDDVCWRMQAKRLSLYIHPEIRDILGRYRSDEVQSGYEDIGLESPHLLNIMAKCDYDDVKIEKPKQLFLQAPLGTFGKQEWIDNLGVDPGEVPSLPLDIHEIWQKPCPFNPGKTIGQTHVLVLIPKDVICKIHKSKDGRTIGRGQVKVPFTLRTFDRLIRAVRGGEWVYINSNTLEQYGDKEVEKSHWVLMTRTVVPGSPGKSYDFEAKIKKKGYEVPSFLDAATSTYLGHAYLSNRINYRHTSSFTACKERISCSIYALRITVSSAPGTLLVSHDDFPNSSGWSNPDLGLAAVRKL